MKNKIKILYDGIQLQLTDSLTKVFWDERPKVMAEEAAVQALRGVFSFRYCVIYGSSADTSMIDSASDTIAANFFTKPLRKPAIANSTITATTAASNRLIMSLSSLTGAYPIRILSKLSFEITRYFRYSPK